MVVNFITGIISAGIPLAAPLLIAGLGEMFNQRAGVFNLGVEGIMMMGAFVGFFVVLTLGSPLLGLLAALAVGAIMGLLMAVVTVKFKAEQGISGIGLFMLGWGLSGTLFRVYVGGITSIKGLSTFSFPLLGKIPYIGEIFFHNNILVYVAFILVPISWYFLHKTAWGLKVRAVGTNPQAADSLGIKVERIRFQCIILGSMMAGLAGAYLTIAQTHIFADNITAGRGFIAVALVYFGKWKPVGIMWGTLLFSTAHALQRSIQVYGINFPYEIAVIIPYLLVIIVLALSYKSKSQGPAALGKPFNRGARE